MGIKDVIIIAVIVAIVGAAAFYIYKAKKSGKKCIGCPDSCSCSSKASKRDNGCCCCGNTKHNETD